jgi:hypothetical protein
VLPKYRSGRIPVLSSVELLLQTDDRRRSMKNNKKMGVDSNLAFWEERFPRKGRAIMEVLRPFYIWKPVLKPPLPDLEIKAKEAVFWRGVTGVRIFSRAEAVSPQDSIGFWLRDSLGDSLGDSLEDPLGNSLRDSLRIALGSVFRFRGSRDDSCVDSIFCTIAYVISDKPDEAAKFKPLLDLWLSGNYPFGFDKDDNLLILVV